MDIIINASISQPPVNSKPVTSQPTHYANLLATLGYSVDELPVADLLRRYHHLEGAWLMCSPIHWHATHNSAMIIASGADLHLSSDDSLRCFEAWATFIADEGMSLHYHDATTWLLHAPKQPPLFAKSPDIIRQQPLTEHLQSLDNSLYWQRFITESQMFFNSHDAINGVWIWGGGMLEAASSKVVFVDSENTEHLASIVSNNTKRLETNSDLTQDGLCLLDDIQLTSAESMLIKHPALAKCMKRYPAGWYWNNLAYATKPTHYLLRLLGY